jgi:hypothetical protein
MYSLRILVLRLSVSLLKSKFWSSFGIAPRQLAASKSVVSANFLVSSAIDFSFFLLFSRLLRSFVLLLSSFEVRLLISAVVGFAAKAAPLSTIRDQMMLIQSFFIFFFYKIKGLNI